MIRIAICDEEHGFCQRLERYISNYMKNDGISYHIAYQPASQTDLIRSHKTSCQAGSPDINSPVISRFLASLPSYI